MKKKILILSMIGGIATIRADLLDTFGFGKNTSSLNVAIGSDKIKEDIAQLRTELELLQNNEKRIQEESQAQTEKSKAQEQAVQMGKFGDNQYSKQLVVVCKSIGQDAKALLTLSKELTSIVKQRITLLEDFVNNRDSEATLAERKTLYTFDDVHSLSNDIASQQGRIDHEQSRKKEISLDLENLQKKVIPVEKAYKDKLKEQADFTKGIQKSDDLFIKVKGELLDAEVILAQYEKELAVLRVKEKEARLALVNDASTLEERRLRILKQKLDFIIRIALRVDIEDVRQAEERLKKEKQHYVTVTESYLQSIEKLTTLEEKARKELLFLEKSYGEPGKEIQDIGEWTSTVKTFEGYLALAELGVKNDELLAIAAEIDVLHARIELEKTKCKEQEINAQMVLSWHKIKHQRFKRSDELFEEVKKYQDLSTELLREKSVYEDKRITATNKLTLQNHALSNLKNHREQFAGKRRHGSPFDEMKNVHIFENFDRGQALISHQIELTGVFIELYSKSLVSLGVSLKQIDAMISELQRVSLWHRSRGAVSWEGVKQAVPDLGMFVHDLRTLINHSLPTLDDFSLTAFGENPAELLYFFLHMLYLLTLLWALWYCLPRLARQLLDVQRDYRGIYIIGKITGFLCLFSYRYLFLLYPWALLFYYVNFGTGVDVYIHMLFYLLSIPYLLYLSWTLVNSFDAFNKESEYDLLTESFQDRFSLVLNYFFAATILILCFREAFLCGGYQKSELPTILLALYSIIVRGLLIALIRKQDLLLVIPSRTPFWARVWEFINTYYYPLLVLFVILMIASDQHIGGYDNLMSYIFWGVVGTAAVLQALTTFYSFFRRVTVSIFFSSDREAFRERFYLARITYSIMALFLLVLFVFLGIWVIAYFWGNSISFATWIEFFTRKNLAIGVTDGKSQQLSILDVMRTISYIPLGFVVASLVDRFILYRLFSLLLVDTGLHNTISAVSYYVVAITFITIGMVHEGFGFLVVYYLGPIFVGIAFALRDVFNDFVSYFIILLQRPLKVGDFIKIDEQVTGVVRRITPRSVLLRRNNSFTLVVPNSRIVNNVIANWDYSKTFIAFPDIVVNIRYFENPNLARDLLLQAIDNTANILKTPAPIIRLEDFGPDGFVFLIRAFISSEKTLEQWDIASNVRFAIVTNLRANGIDLSFPVQIVHLKHDKTNV